jgi:hypothetical protein
VLRAQLAALDGEPERAAVLAAEALEREPLHTAARAVAAP